MPAKHLPFGGIILAALFVCSSRRSPSRRFLSSRTVPDLLRLYVLDVERSTLPIRRDTNCNATRLKPLSCRWRVS